MAVTDIEMETEEKSHNDAKNKPSQVPLPTQLSHCRWIVDQGGLTDAVICYPYSGSGEIDDPYVVHWIPNDPRNPLNLSTKMKWLITMTVGGTTMTAALISSGYSGGINQVMEHFDVSREVATLGMSLFVIGFAFGPFLWAPLGEIYGRQRIFCLTVFGLTVFTAAAAGSQNIQTLLILRLIAGVFGASPMTNAGGVLADIWPPAQRGLAMNIFSVAPSLGPVFGPVIGGFIGMLHGWRWVQAFMAFLAGFFWVVGMLIVPETYAPVLLHRRAEKLSKLTGKAYWSKGDDNRKTKSESFKIALLRPWRLLLREPIVTALSFYSAIIFGTLYMFFAAYPIVYEQTRKWSQGVSTLPFIAIFIGLMSSFIYMVPENRHYIKVQQQNGGHAPPETRLRPALVGCYAIPIGIFWFAWTNSPSVHWLASVAAGVPFGFGFGLVFVSILNYLMDAYTIFSASAFAANTVLRCSFGAVFPLFASYMYSGLGIHWASSVPAFLAVLCVPFPMIFAAYGPAIRKRCKFAAESAAYLQILQEVSVAQANTEDGGQKVVTGEGISEV
ncbi:hypothetical protein Plec18170_002232 [Paecilomyces lecythidis]